jgi:hypothetical protein
VSQASNAKDFFEVFSFAYLRLDDNTVIDVCNISLYNINMNLSKSETRLRHAHIDSVLDETIHNLEDNKNVAAYMDPAMRGKLAKMIGSAFVLNAKHDTLSIPKSYRSSDAIPIVALQATERPILGAGFGTMTPTQRSSLSSWPEPPSTYERIVAQNEGKQKIGGRSGSMVGTRAYVGNVIAYGNLVAPEQENGVGAKQAYWIYGRPVVAMLANHDGNFAPDIKHSGTVVHEFVHVDQFQRLPIRPVTPDAGDRLRAHATNELEAFHHAAYYELGLTRSDDPRYKDNNAVINNAPVEHKRLQYADPARPFDAPPAFMNWLTEVGAI